MDPGHTLPPLPTEGSSQPPIREQSPSSGTDHPDSGGHSSTEKPLLGPSEGHSPPRITVPSDGDRTRYSATERPPPRDLISSHPDLEPINFQGPPPARSRDGHMHALSRGLSRRTHMHSTSGIDYLVPVTEKPHLRTLGERLAPTIQNATVERDKYSVKAQWTSYALNIAIGLQVLLGALTTGIAAALTGKQTGIAISLLGGMSTLVASYLARARGSNEPELSITRVKDLDQFLRDCASFVMDHGHEYGTPENKLDIRLNELRRRFEELLGNADGQRKLSPPV